MAVTLLTIHLCPLKKTSTMNLKYLFSIVILLATISAQATPPAEIGADANHNTSPSSASKRSSPQALDAKSGKQTYPAFDGDNRQTEPASNDGFTTPLANKDQLVIPTQKAPTKALEDVNKPSVTPATLNNTKQEYIASPKGSNSTTLSGQALNRKLAEQEKTMEGEQATIGEHTLTPFPQSQ